MGVGGGARREWNNALQVPPLGGQFCSEKMEFWTSPDLTVHVCPLPCPSMGHQKHFTGDRTINMSVNQMILSGVRCPGKWDRVV